MFLILQAIAAAGMLRGGRGDQDSSSSSSDGGSSICCMVVGAGTPNTQPRILQLKVTHASTPFPHGIKRLFDLLPQSTGMAVKKLRFSIFDERESVKLRPLFMSFCWFAVVFTVGFFPQTVRSATFIGADFSYYTLEDIASVHRTFDQLGYIIRYSRNRCYCYSDLN